MTLDILLYLLTVIFVYFYVSSKAKNLAAKEDLEELTRKVEEVKSEYNKQNEFLKSNLNYELHRKNQIFNEEKEAIVAFLSNLNTWIWDGLNVHLGDYNTSNYLELADRIVKMNDHYRQTQIQHSRMQLFVKEQKLIEISSNAILSTLKLHQFVEERSNKLKKSLERERGFWEVVYSKDFKIEDMSKEIKEIFKSSSEQYGKLKEAALDNYYDEYMKMFEPAMNDCKAFIAEAKSYLNI